MSQHSIKIHENQSREHTWSKIKHIKLGSNELSLQRVHTVENSEFGYEYAFVELEHEQLLQ